MSALKFIALVSLAGFAMQTLILQYKRRRKVPDVTLDFWRFGFLCLLSGLLLLGLQRAVPVRVNIDVVLGVLIIVGFIQSLIIGMLYKIIPFLVWLHLTNAVDMSARWQLKIPNMKQIVPDRHARTQLMLHSLSVILLLVSVILQPVLWVAATTFLLSNLYLAFNLIRGVSVYRKFIALAEAADRLKSE